VAAQRADGAQERLRGIRRGGERRDPGVDRLPIGFSVFILFY